MNTFTNRKLIRAFEEGRKICEELNIPIGCVKTVKENSRFTSTWGRCRKTSRYTYEIEINSRLLENDVPPEVLMNTMLHELIHTCKNCMDHREVFKRYAARLNRIGWDIQTYVSEAEYKAVPSDPVIYRYRVTCNDCGEVWNYSKRGAVVRSLQRNPKSCTCHCGSRDLTLVEL